MNKVVATVFFCVQTWLFGDLGWMVSFFLFFFFFTYMFYPLLALWDGMSDYYLPTLYMGDLEFSDRMGWIDRVM